MGTIGGGVGDQGGRRKRDMFGSVISTMAKPPKAPELHGGDPNKIAKSKNNQDLALKVACPSCGVVKQVMEKNNEEQAKKDKKNNMGG